MKYQVSVNPSAMTDGEVRKALLPMAQAIPTQDQAMTAQANKYVAPREKQHSIIGYNYLRDFTRMNPTMFFGSKIAEHPLVFLDKV